MQFPTRVNHMKGRTSLMCYECPKIASLFKLQMHCKLEFINTWSVGSKSANFKYNVAPADGAQRRETSPSSNAIF